LYDKCSFTGPLPASFIEHGLASGRIELIDEDVCLFDENRRTSIEQFINSEDIDFVHILSEMLQIDQTKRRTAMQLLTQEWLSDEDPEASRSDTCSELYSELDDGQQGESADNAFDDEETS
jgi:hypothetical protein